MLLRKSCSKISSVAVSKKEKILRFTSGECVFPAHNEVFFSGITKNPISNKVLPPTERECPLR